MANLKRYLDVILRNELIGQMSVNQMMVAVRIRPLSSQERENGIFPCCQTFNEQIVTIKKEACGGYLKSQMGSITEYAFDAVFDANSTQREIYETTTKPYLKNLIDGFNVTVFAYGATGAGKTHTMMGNSRVDDASGQSQDSGIIPNALDDIFDMISEKRNGAEHGEDYSVIVSFIEVYNEQVYDLLDTSGRVLSLREDQEKGVVVVAGVIEKDASSSNDVIELLYYGNKNRKTEATMANQVSSRSHAVLQLTLRHTRRTDSGREAVTESKLSLIDLAGSERASATNNRGARLQEGANINKSLLALANCINALAGNTSSLKRTNVKYRDSKLTHLLKSSLEGNCNLIMIANINPSHLTYEDSHNTLKYANRAKNIKVNPCSVELTKESNWMERESRLREENAILRDRVQELEAEVYQLKAIINCDVTYLKDDVVNEEEIHFSSIEESVGDCVERSNVDISTEESTQNNEANEYQSLFTKSQVTLLNDAVNYKDKMTKRRKSVHGRKSMIPSFSDSTSSLPIIAEAMEENSDLDINMNESINATKEDEFNLPTDVSFSADDLVMDKSFERQFNEVTGLTDSVLAVGLFAGDESVHPSFTFNCHTNKASGEIDSLARRLETSSSTMLKMGNKNMTREDSPERLHSILEIDIDVDELEDRALKRRRGSHIPKPRSRQSICLSNTFDKDVNDVISISKHAGKAGITTRRMSMGAISRKIIDGPREEIKSSAEILATRSAKASETLITSENSHFSQFDDVTTKSKPFGTEKTKDVKRKRMSMIVTAADMQENENPQLTSKSTNNSAQNLFKNGINNITKTFKKVGIIHENDSGTNTDKAEKINDTNFVENIKIKPAANTITATNTTIKLLDKNVIVPTRTSNRRKSIATGNKQVWRDL